MRTTYILGSLFFVSLFGIVFSSPTIAQAMTLPPLLEHEGLTIAQPLTVSDTSSTALTMSLSFGEQQEIAVTPPATKAVLAEAVVIPTLADEDENPLSTAKPGTKSQSITRPAGSTGTPVTTPKPSLKTPEPITQKTTTTTPTQIKSGPTSTPTAAPTTAPQLQLSNGGLNADKLFSMSNAYRQTKGLSQLQKDDRVCQIASSRAPEIAAEIAEGHMHSGIRDRNLPYWNSEIIITMRTEEEAFNWWINDTIHREAIEGNYTYSCTACNGNACVQEFTNFQAK